MARSYYYETGANLSASQTDTVGILDFRTTLLLRLLTAENESVKDRFFDPFSETYTSLITTLLSRLLTANAVGILDSSSQVLASLRSQTDNEGILDSVSRILTALRLIIDSDGITDSRSRLLTSLRSQTESEGTIDSQSQVLAALKSFTDSLSITDTKSQTGTYSQSHSESQGLVDSRFQLLTAIRSLNDSEELSDTISQLVAIIRSQSDTEDIEDAATQGGTFEQLIIESISLLDLMMFVVDFVRNQTDQVDISDADVYQLITILAPILLAESLGLTDTNTNSLEKMIFEDIDVSDLISHIADYLRDQLDTESILDQYGTIHSLTLRDVVRIRNYLLDTLMVFATIQEHSYTVEITEHSAIKDLEKI